MTKTVSYTSSNRPPLETHVQCMNDKFVNFLLSDLSPERNYPIVTNQYCIPLTQGPYIFFNMEQLTYPKMLREVCERSRRNDIVEVWDYSLVNVNILQSHGIVAKHVPLRTTPEDIAKLKSYIPSTPVYDVGFCGVAPPRRMKLLEEIGKKGLKLLLCNTTYGEERDRLLASCRVHINIHQSDEHTVYESTRCNHWLEAGIPVISEHSLDDDPRCRNVSYETLVETVVEFCKKTSNIQWIDSILFNGDSIMQLRLQYLYPHIDKMYICEQLYTHQGTKKEQLYIDLYKDWFAPYLDKVVFLVDETDYSNYSDTLYLEELKKFGGHGTELYTLYKNKSWNYEIAHRNYAAKKILETHKGQHYIVSVCDCDEIPDAAVVKANLTRLYDATTQGAVYMEQLFMYYNLNWLASKWYKAFFVNNRLLERYSTFQGFRDKLFPCSPARTIPCGWHCSFFMTIQEIIRKLQSFAHSEHNIPEYTNELHVSRCIQTGNDLFRRGSTLLQPNPIQLEQFPKELQQFHSYIRKLQQAYYSV